MRVLKALGSVFGRESAHDKRQLTVCCHVDGSRINAVDVCRSAITTVHPHEKFDVLHIMISLMEKFSGTKALLGHTSPNTVMIYAKLYPSQLIEEYRKTVRSLYNAYYGEDGLKNPTAEEWAAFTASCNLRDMGTHLCALPTVEHCPKGLICLGCAHAQPKKTAVPIFRRMLASHGRSLAAARGHNEPAGQIAAREIEIVRIKGALQRAEELSDDVAAAIERALRNGKLSILDPTTLIRFGDTNECCVNGGAQGEDRPNYSLFPTATYQYLKKNAPEFGQVIDDSGREAAERTRWRDLPFLASVPVGSFPQKLSGTILPFATKTI
jgi:hypothetical protein